MKVAAVNNIHFQGLYTSKQNKNEWKIEYQPYSWEKVPSSNKFGADAQADFDITADKLPDNEKISIETHPRKYDFYPKHGRDSMNDILGTEFYYNDYEKNTLRDQIEYLEAMNLEDSLKVYNKKLDKFLELKKNAQDSLEKSFSEKAENLNYHSQQFDKYSKDYDKSILNRFHSRKSDKKHMVSEKRLLENSANELYNNIDKYIRIKNSANAIKEKRAEIEAIILKLQTAREAGKLIDISQRVYVNEPNKALIEGLKNINNIKDKLIALPHKVISVNDIINHIQAKTNVENFAQETMKYVDFLIMHKK